MTKNFVLKLQADVWLRIGRKMVNAMMAITIQVAIGTEGIVVVTTLRKFGAKIAFAGAKTQIMLAPLVHNWQSMVFARIPPIQNG